jgi:nucleoside-diphosphate-sugar epimerase
MKIAVTGASGFIGARLSRYLRERGHEVIALVRKGGRGLPPEAGDVSVRTCDLSDIGSLESAFRGAEAVIHLAALFNRPEASWEEYRRVNVAGTEKVLMAAERCGAGRVVHCSTVGVATGNGTPPYSERTPYSPPAWDKYETTKCEGEKLALEYGKKTGYPVVVIRPAQVYGSGDGSKVKFYRLVKKGIIVDPGNTMKHLIYVDDLCRAFEMALLRDDAEGEAFIIGGEKAIPLRELIRLAAEELRVPPPRIVLPAAPVTWVCAATEIVCGPLRIKPPLFRRSMDFFTKSVEFDVSKARERLGFASEVAVPEGVRRTVAWYLERGLV